MDLDDEEFEATKNISKEKIIKKCHWCKKDLYEKNIVEEGNARGYGYYIYCPNCGNRNVIQEIREFY